MEQLTALPAPPVSHTTPRPPSRRSRAWRELTYDGALDVPWGMALLAVGQVRRLSIQYEHWAWKRCMAAAGDGPLTVKVLGKEMVLAPTDKGISRELAAYRIHEPLATMALRKVLKPGMNVIDLGANIGYYTLIESEAVGDTGRVIAIEPVPENVALLRENVERNECRNVRIISEAMANYEGTGKIHISAKSNWHSMLESKHSIDDLDVPVSTVDEVVRRFDLPTVDLVRMDIEGYEIVAIEGMRETLARHRPWLMIELHPQIAGVDAIVRLLRDLQALHYDLELVIERRRDWPWKGAWRVRDMMRGLPFGRFDRMSFDELVADRRLAVECRPISILCGPGRSISSNGTVQPVGARAG